MVRALVVGFILGFAMVGMLRLSASGQDGALLAGTSAIKPGAAVNLAALRVARVFAWRSCDAPFWPMRTLA